MIDWLRWLSTSCHYSSAVRDLRWTGPRAKGCNCNAMLSHAAQVFVWFFIIFFSQIEENAVLKDTAWVRFFREDFFDWLSVPLKPCPIHFKWSFGVSSGFHFAMFLSYNVRQPITNKTEIIRNFAYTCFPRLALVSCFCFKFWLVHFVVWFDCADSIIGALAKV